MKVEEIKYNTIYYTKDNISDEIFECKVWRIIKTLNDKSQVNIKFEDPSVVNNQSTLIYISELFKTKKMAKKELIKNKNGQIDYLKQKIKELK